MTTTTKAATRFAAILLRRGIRSAWVAERTGYSVQAVRSWRCGARQPSIGAVALLAAALGVAPKELQGAFERKG